MKIKKPIPISTANGEIELTESCVIYVRELGMHLPAYVHKGTVAILSLGLLCQDLGFTYEWKPNASPTLTKEIIKSRVSLISMCPSFMQDLKLLPNVLQKTVWTATKNLQKK